MLNTGCFTKNAFSRKCDFTDYFVFYSPQKILCVTLKWECAKIGRYPNFQLQNVLWGMFQYLNILSWPCEDHVFNRHVTMESCIPTDMCYMTPDLTRVQVDHIQACDRSIEEFAVFSLVKTSSCTPWLWQRFITDAKEGEGVFFYIILRRSWDEINLASYLDIHVDIMIRQQKYFSP